MINDSTSHSIHKILSVKSNMKESQQREGNMKKGALKARENLFRVEEMRSENARKTLSKKLETRKFFSNFKKTVQMILLCECVYRQK